MAIVESVVEILLEKLSDPLIGEALFLHGVRDQVEWLMEEFKWIIRFLEDADAKQGDERVKNWLRDVTDVAYDAEDFIDTFAFKVATLRRTGFLGCIKRYTFIFNELIARHQVGSKIERLKIKIDAISQRGSTYGIENIGQGAGTTSAGRSHQEWRLTCPLSQEPDFVGFEKELEMLVARLTEGELRRCVVSVVGMGGLGKTTLTKKLYNADTVKKHFQIHAWISVSQEYFARDLLQTIAKCSMVLSKEELELVEKMEVVDLRDKISEYLNDKRYLVVLDDLWQIEAWDALKDAFPDVNNGSRVVLTTRNKDVALYADPRSQPHELRFLTNEESWDLFGKKAFLERDGDCPQDLEKVGREIVEKCHGLPLAIAVVGGILSVKEPWEWENVCKSISWQLVEGEVQIISSILSLSYKYLPYDLKPCFLYLANFPADYEFKAKELIRLWAAEGFLKERMELTLEEVGEDYLMQLVQRSMVQLTKRNSSKGIKSCLIHDLLRDLSISEAKESKFLEVQADNAPPASRARRLALIHLNDPSKYISLSSSTPHIRSLLFYTPFDAHLSRSGEKLLYRGFKLLRVLRLHGFQIKNLPTEVGELIHLRYLRCTKTLLKSLPSSIGNLLNLQTLHVTSTSDINIPSTITNMYQLRHLQVAVLDKVNYLGWMGNWGLIQGHPRLDSMRNLQTLSQVKACKWMEGCLGKLTNLRKLCIALDTEADAEVFYESIVNMHCLSSLSVVTLAHAYRTLGLLVPNLSHLLKLSKLLLEGKLDKLPESTEFPTNLTKLTLAYSCLNQDPMATLEKLRNLRILRLLGYSYVGVEMVCSAQGFPRLESLHLQGLFQLVEWRVEVGAMPSLLQLQISTCHNLKKLPEGLRHLNTLKTLGLRYMLNDFQQRLREYEGEDWHKVQHIPSININNDQDASNSPLGSAPFAGPN